MSRTLKWILAANLIVLAILAFVYPHLMVGPGKLIPGHAKLESDCFACHAGYTRLKPESPVRRWAILFFIKIACAQMQRASPHRHAMGEIL